MKSRFIAVILTFLLGFLGVHRFYLGQLIWGIGYSTLLIVSLLFLFYGIGIFGLVVLAVLVLIDLMTLLLMDNKTFDFKYNRDVIKEH